MSGNLQRREPTPPPARHGVGLGAAVVREVPPPGLWLTAQELAGPLPVAGLLLRRWALEQQLAQGPLQPDWWPVLRMLQQEAAATALQICQQGEPAEQLEQQLGQSCTALQWSLEPLSTLPAEQLGPMREELATCSSQLLGGLHRLLMAADDPQPLWWLAQAAGLAYWHRRAELGSPAWMGPVEEQLVRAAALQWLERARSNPSAERSTRALTLLEHLAGLHQPCPDWILLAQQELSRGNTELPATSQTGAATQHAQATAIQELRLEVRPGEAELISQGELLVVNVADRLDAPASDPLGGWFKSLLRQHGEEQQRQLRLHEPESSLHSSLQQLWRRGELIPEGWFRRLALAADHWRRSGGEAVLPWPDFPAGRLEPGCLLVRPGNVELAALRTALEQPEAQGPALEAIAARGAERQWMEALRDDWWCDPCDATENLRRLHTNAGFYADPADPLGCLEAWRDGTLAALRRGQVLSGHITAWMAPVSQAITQRDGVVPQLVQWSEDRDWYRFLAGKQVLFVTPLAADVQQQHNSGRAFDLFHDLPIEPFSLRCLPAPMSVYPNRPDQGFKASLERCIEAVDGAWRQQPFEVFTAACGAYGLPLCAAVQARYGVASVYAGNIMHALFGLLQRTTISWRAASRKEQNWRSSGLLDQVAGVDRIEGGRYLGLDQAQR